MKCKVLEPISLGGGRVEPGTEVDLSNEEWARLRPLGCVELVDDNTTEARARASDRKRS